MNKYTTTPNRNAVTSSSRSLGQSPPYTSIMQHVVSPPTFSFVPPQPNTNIPSFSSSTIMQSPPYTSKIQHGDAPSSFSASNPVRQSPPYTSKLHNDSASSSASEASPGNRSRSFSITDILSDNTGSSSSRKRSNPTESLVNVQEKTPRVIGGEGGVLLSPSSSAAPVASGQQQQGLLSLMQAGGVVMSPVNACLPLSPALCQSTTAPYQNQVAGYFHPLSMLAQTHAPPPPPPPSFYLRGGGGGQTGVYPVLPSQLQENMADMKLVSRLDDSGNTPHDTSTGSTEEESVHTNVTGRNGSRSALKKLDINEHAAPISATSAINTTPKSSQRYSQQPPQPVPNPYLPNYLSWSPLPNPAATFSPSIFLTCPSGAPPPPPVVHPITRSSPQSVSSPEDKVGGANQFMTSTPIRRGDRIHLVSPSRVHSPISSANNTSSNSNRGQQQQEQNMSSNEYNSSASDSEMPLLHRPRVPRRRPPRARTSLNPLLENTNTSTSTPPPPPPPPSRPSLPPPSVPPSSLLTSYKLSSQFPSSFSDSGIVPDSSPSLLYRSAYGPLMEVSPAQYQHHPQQLQKTPVKGRLERGGGGGYHARIMCGSSPVTDHLNKTGQIQSVPPWFVCSDKKSDGKRLRLTEAINRSLSESVTTQKQHQLPAEWQKLAYGQTEDQKILTRKARNFLKGRPRVLKFDSMITNRKKVN